MKCIGSASPLTVAVEAAFHAVGAVRLQQWHLSELLALYLDKALVQTSRLSDDDMAVCVTISVRAEV